MAGMLGHCHTGECGGRMKKVIDAQKGQYENVVVG